MHTEDELDLMLQDFDAELCDIPFDTMLGNKDMAGMTDGSYSSKPMIDSTNQLNANNQATRPTRKTRERVNDLPLKPTKTIKSTLKSPFSYTSNDTPTLGNIVPDFNNFSGIFDFQNLTTNGEKDTTVGPTNIPSSSSVKNTKGSNTKNSRKRCLPVDNLVNTAISAKSSIYVKEESKLPTNQSGVNGLISGSPFSTFNAKDEMLLNSLLGNNQYSLSDEDDNEFGDDDDFDQDALNSTTADGDDHKKKRGRKVSCNPDTAIIAAAIDAHLKKMNLDPESKEGKRQRRRLRNRMSAQLHRERKKAYIDELESKVREKDVVIDRLSKEIEILKKENALLKSKNSQGKGFSARIENIRVSEGVTSDEDSESHVSDDSSLKQNPKSHPSYRLLSVILLICFAVYGIHPEISTDSSGIISLQTHTADSSSFLSWNAKSFHQSALDAYDPQSSNFLVVENLASQIPQRKLFSTDGNVNFDQMPQSQNNDANQESLPILSPLLSEHVDNGNQIINFSKEYMETPNSESKMSVTDTDSSANPPALTLAPVMSLPPVPLTISSPSKLMTNNYALWKYQSHVFQLYPHLSRHVDENQNHSDQLRSRRYLRVRREQKIVQPVVILSSSKDFSQIPDTVSRVLVTEGKTLLDPALAFQKDQNISPKTSHYFDLSKGNRVAGDPRIQTQVNHNIPTDEIRPLLAYPGGVVLSTQSDIHSNVNVHEETSSTSTAVMISPQIDSRTSAESNLLVMLLPAKSVRWGKSWSDSADKSLEWMIRNLNSTDNFDSFVSNHDEGMSTSDSRSTQHEAREDLWVEIGCTIFRAQLVRNVTI